jgi:hypothetical protein
VALNGRAASISLSPLCAPSGRGANAYRLSPRSGFPVGNFEEDADHEYVRRSTGVLTGRALPVVIVKLVRNFSP